MLTLFAQLQIQRGREIVSLKKNLLKAQNFIIRTTEMRKTLANEYLHIVDHFVRLGSV